MLLGLGAFIASMIKIAQGSCTVAMITVSAMMAAMLPSTDTLGYHPAYLATAIGGGSMIGSWMNDSGLRFIPKSCQLSNRIFVPDNTPGSVFCPPFSYLLINNL